MEFWHDYKKNLKVGNLETLQEAKKMLSVGKKELCALKDIITLNAIPKSFLQTNLGMEFLRFKSQVLAEISNSHYLEEKLSQHIRQYQNGKTSIKDTFDMTVIGVKYIYSTKSLKKLFKDAGRFSEKIKNQQEFSLAEKQEPFKKIIFPHSSFWIRIVEFLYASKDVREIFNPIVTDWQGEYFEALFKKEVWKARWINVRYTYAFIVAMWQKSPIGDLIEFVSKIAK